MAIETTSNERTQQLDTGCQNHDEDLNQPDKFSVKRKRTKMKGRMNLEGNEPNEKDQRISQIVEPHVSITSPHDVMIPHLSLSSPEMPLLDITQLDNPLPNSEDLTMIAENQTSDVQVSNVTHSWFQNSLQKKKKVIQTIPPPFDVISSILQKPPKTKKTKVMSRLAIDENSGNLCVEVARPIVERNVDEASESDFILDKVDLGPSNAERDFQNFEVTAAQILQRAKKEKRTKEQLKEQVQMLVSFINSISGSSNAQTGVTPPILTGPDGILDHTVVERIDKHKSHSMMIEAWIKRMIEDASKLIIGVKEIYGKAIK